jgi:hypothetical protein
MLSKQANRKSVGLDFQKQIEPILKSQLFFAQKRKLIFSKKETN